MAKKALTEPQALQILEDYENGCTMTELAAIFGVHRRTIYGVLHGRSYQNARRIHEEKKEVKNEISSRSLREILSELREVDSPCCLTFPEARAL